jgi:hypothetical protein
MPMVSSTGGRWLELSIRIEESHTRMATGARHDWEILRIMHTRQSRVDLRG